jgi:predicted ATPase
MQTNRPTGYGRAHRGVWTGHQEVVSNRGPAHLTSMHSAASRRLAITRFELLNHRSLRVVRWPEDGLGWAGRVPEIVLVGGINGSGKTTLLETLFGMVGFMVSWHERHEHEDIRHQALRWLPRGAQSIALGLHVGEGTHYELAIRSSEFPNAPVQPGHSAIWMPPPEESEIPEILPSAESLDADRHALAKLCMKAEGPSLLYFPTDRAVPIPSTTFKRPGARDRAQKSPIYRYEVPTEWERSVEAVLYDARWRDINAMEHGAPAEATNFAIYAEALEQFFGGSKRLVWDRDGVLHVETKHGDRHAVNALSSGEKQVLLFVAELFRRWTPGSLVLVDEPELHLHESWLASLWGALRRLQRDRGGQVVITTQSSYLFGLAKRAVAWCWAEGYGEALKRDHRRDRAGPASHSHGEDPLPRGTNGSVREVLVVLWEAADRVCGKRLRAAIPLWAMDSPGCSSSIRRPP